MEKKDTYHRENLKDELLVAAEGILNQDGLKNVTLRELARVTGVSHGAPQRHFKNRQDLLDTLAQDGFTKLQKSLQTAIAAAQPNFSAQLRAAVSAFSQFATSNAALFQLMNANKHEPATSALETLATSAYDPIVNVIKRGQVEQQVVAGKAEDISMPLYAALLGLTTMANAGLINKTQLDRHVSATLDYFLKGVKPD